MHFNEKESDEKERTHTTKAVNWISVPVTTYKIVSLYIYLRKYGVEKERVDSILIADSEKCHT